MHCPVSVQVNVTETLRRWTFHHCHRVPGSKAVRGAEMEAGLEAGCHRPSLLKLPNDALMLIITFKSLFVTKSHFGQDVKLVI